MLLTKHISSIFIVLISFRNSPFVECSVGDSYVTYRECFQKCEKSDCVGEHGHDYSPSMHKGIFVHFLWKCCDNCKYECMWPMVRICAKNGWAVPQFGGKWPFVRWLGMQEPASVVFSLLNLCSSLCMYRTLYKAIRVRSTMYWIWTFHAVVSANAWLWSVCFHIRDIPFTELMDYISASSLVYYTFYAFGYRMLLFQGLLPKVLFAGGCLFFFIQHCLYLIMKPFDYNYNLDTLIIIGVLTGIIMLLWCFWNWNSIKHVKYAALYVSSTMLVALLEIFDFPPIMWTFDAHSLWHFATIPLPYFIYKFAIEDCRYLRRKHQNNISIVARF